MNFKQLMGKNQRVLLLLVIVGIVAVVAMINPKFIAMKNIIIIFQQISVIGILTMAISILLIGGGIDLSIGNIMVLSGIIMARILEYSGNVFLAIVAGIACGICCGLLNGMIIARSKCIPLIITLGTGQVFYGISLMLSKGRILSFFGAFDTIGKTKILGIFPTMLFVLLGMVVCSYIIMNWTRFGRRLVAIGGNEKNAFLSGIDIGAYKLMMYALSGAFCAIASIIFSSRIDSITANAGLGYETGALTAAIIGGVTFEGGKGTIFGAFLGCILMGVIGNAMNILKVDPYLQTVITGIIIVAAVVLSNIHHIRRR